HTRFSRDWSSDVCSSDLGAKPQAAIWSLMFVTMPVVIVSMPLPAAHLGLERPVELGRGVDDDEVAGGDAAIVGQNHIAIIFETRSEERRVGKECTSGLGA